MCVDYKIIKEKIDRLLLTLIVDKSLYKCIFIKTDDFTCYEIVISNVVDKKIINQLKHNITKKYNEHIEYNKVTKLEYSYVFNVYVKGELNLRESKISKIIKNIKNVKR